MLPIFWVSFWAGRKIFRVGRKIFRWVKNFEEVKKCLRRGEMFREGGGEKFVRGGQKFLGGKEKFIEGLKNEVVPKKKKKKKKNHQKKFWEIREKKVS